MYKTIFVSIASYRDKYCTPTLESIYENATYPQNVYVGICAQNSQDDKNENCAINKPNLKLYSTNVRTIHLKDYEAKGPTWARYLCTTLMNNEDYFLQIDSHTLFEPGWDVTLIDMMNDIKKNTSSKDVIISHYPPIYEDYDKKDKNVKNVTALCQSFFNEKGMISLTGAEWVDTTKHKYIQTPHIAGGMIFCEGKCIQEVPYDPNLPNLFVGEEILKLIGIDANSFAVAGSFVLFFLALEMILGVRLYKEDNPSTASIVPIAFPLIAGAGTMTTLLSLRAAYDKINIIIAILINVILVYAVLKSSGKIEKLLGVNGLGIIRKVFGVILLAISIKLFAANVKGLFI
jgi:multiple antibiotic resistance protein